MADNADSGSDAQITFKVKTSSDGLHVITMAESATVLELKTKLAGAEFENVPVERQRLIYSGRVMKNDDALGNYKIKPNNTIHMVKSAASNQAQPSSSSSTATPPAVPTNMASGTANNPLAGLTGARYAGHQINLPGMDMFGPDGGMGPPMDEERLSRMMADPNVQQTMNEALNNPDFVNMLIESNPMLRNMPNAREIITSPYMRQMMTDPSMMSQAMRMQRQMRGGNSSFPAPGATNSTPEGAAASGESPNTAAGGQNAQNPFGGANPFMFPGLFGAGGGANPSGQGQGQQQPSLHELIAQLQGLNSILEQSRAATATPGAQAGSGATESQTAAAGTGNVPSSSPRPGSNPTSPPPAANPFAALFPGGADGAQPGIPFGGAYNPEAMQEFMRMLGGGESAAAPADTRPPEERYAEQLRQLNDMGFFDFDRNVSALRRSGGSVQGAIEHLLNGA